METLVVVSVIFFCSLGGAFVLFKFLKSTAIIQRKNHQAGGAIAVFLLIYSMLYGSFYHIDSMAVKRDYENLRSKHDRLDTENKKLNNVTKKRIISGTVTPRTNEIKVILAVKHTDPDSNGNFRMNASCIDPIEDEVRLYVIQEDRHTSSILTKVPMQDIKINLGVPES